MSFFRTSILCFREEIIDSIPTRYISIVILVGFMIALVIHSLQTEATYRLDFVWKLQATGKLY